MGTLVAFTDSDVKALLQAFEVLVVTKPQC